VFCQGLIKAGLYPSASDIKTFYVGRRDNGYAYAVLRYLCDTSDVDAKERVHVFRAGQVSSMQHLALGVYNYIYRIRSR
jgi:hypothetical protein